MRLLGLALGVAWAVVLIVAAVHIAPRPAPADRNTINHTWPYRLHEALDR